MYTVQDKVKLTLESYGEQDISATLDELSVKSGLKKSAVYQALYRLQGLHEIEIIKTKQNNRELIIGVRLLKMEPHSKIINKSVEKDIAREREEAVNNLNASFPHLLSYLKQRLAVENAKEQLVAAGLQPEEVIKFEPNPMAEEAMALLQRLIDKTSEAIELKYERDAAKRDNEFYEKQKKEETQTMLAASK